MRVLRTVPYQACYLFIFVHIFSGKSVEQETAWNMKTTSKQLNQNDWRSEEQIRRTLPAAYQLNLINFSLPSLNLWDDIINSKLPHGLNDGNGSKALTRGPFSDFSSKIFFLDLEHKGAKKKRKKKSYIPLSQILVPKGSTLVSYKEVF